MNEELKAACVRAVQRIHKIPFSDWGEADFLAEVLYEEFAPMFTEKDETRGAR